MSGRKSKVPAGTKIDGNRVVMPNAKSRDSSQARSWAKGGRKGKWRPLKKGVSALLNSIGKTK